MSELTDEFADLADIARHLGRSGIALSEQNGEIDFGPIAQRIYDEVLIDQRPS